MRQSVMVKLEQSKIEIKDGRLDEIVFQCPKT